MKKLLPLILLWALSLFAWAQPVVKAPDIITGIVAYKQSVTIKGQTIALVGTRENPAILALEGKYSNFNDNTIKVVGYGWVCIYRADNAGVRRNDFQAGLSTVLKIIRANNVTTDGNIFRGQVDPKDIEKHITENELMVIEPGHPWTFEDAAETGWPYNPATRYTGGTNRLAAVNRLNEERRGEYAGSKTVEIVYGDRIPTFKSEFAKLNRWFVWQKDNKVHELEFLSATEKGVVLRAIPALTPGPFRYGTYNPKALITGNVVKNNWFYGPGRSTGFSAYGTDGLIVERNVACGFADYGLGIEVSIRGVMRFNYAYGNQQFMNQVNPTKVRTWNQMEIVGGLGVHYLKGNIGIVCEGTHFYPPNQVQSDLPVRQVFPKWEPVAIP